jgi:glutamine synthetase
VDELRCRTDALTRALDHQPNGSLEDHARYCRDTILPAMTALRDVGDRIEVVMPSDSWPLPTYREMLFIK